jgi:hypothetical protein
MGSKDLDEKVTEDSPTGDSLPETLFECIRYLITEPCASFSPRDVGVLYVQCLNDIVERSTAAGQPPYKKLVFPALGAQVHTLEKKKGLYEEAVTAWFVDIVQKHWIDKVDKEEILDDCGAPTLPFPNDPRFQSSGFASIESELYRLSQGFTGDQFYEEVGARVWKGLQNFHEKVKNPEAQKPVGFLEYMSILREMQQQP